MNQQLVLIVLPDSGPNHEWEARLVSAAHELDLATECVPETEVSERLQVLIAAGREPAVVLIGPEVRNPLALARQVRAVDAQAQLLFVPTGEQLPKLRRALQHAPMIGPNWSLVEPGDPALAEQLRRAVAAARQRMRLRTTLDRANVQLRAPRPVDSLDYRRLVLSEHYLANLLAQSQEAVLSLDTRHAVLYWSAGAERLLGLRAVEAYGLPVSSLPFWTPALDEALARVHAGAATLTTETRMSRAEGALHLEVFLSRVHDDSGRFIGTSFTLRDISLRNRMLEMERAARREAERMSRMKDEFLAILSHELRTPLSAVIGRTQLLRLKYRDDDVLDAALVVIERNALMQAKLIEDLLDISAVITGKLRLDLRPVALQPLMEAAVESVRHQAEAKRLRLLADINLPAIVQGDPHRLQQVLYNLLVNAVKFTPEGGEVRLAARCRNRQVEISVTDTGIGIDPAFLPLVFDRFGQEDASTTRRHGGLGLGLSIAKQLVELHGGEIRADSAGRHRGARFTLTLPLQDADAVAARAEAPDEALPSSLQGQRILVVEDVADARQLLHDVLQGYGAEVMAVESGTEALASLDRFQPHVLVSDIGMPGMDGYQLLRSIRGRGFTAERLPALALSAYASESHREAAMLAGYQLHLPKPLVVEELVSAVGRLARRA